jgi:hypothetical protein
MSLWAVQTSASKTSFSDSQSEGAEPIPQVDCCQSCSQNQASIIPEAACVTELIAGGGAAIEDVPAVPGSREEPGGVQNLEML